MVDEAIRLWAVMLDGPAEDRWIGRAGSPTRLSGLPCGLLYDPNGEASPPSDQFIPHMMLEKLLEPGKRPSTDHDRAASVRPRRFQNAGGHRFSVQRGSQLDFPRRGRQLPLCGVSPGLWPTQAERLLRPWPSTGL